MNWHSVRLMWESEKECEPLCVAVSANTLYSCKSRSEIPVEGVNSDLPLSQTVWSGFRLPRAGATPLPWMLTTYMADVVHWQLLIKHDTFQTLLKGMLSKGSNKITFSSSFKKWVGVYAIFSSLLAVSGMGFMRCTMRGIKPKLLSWWFWWLGSRLHSITWTLW